MDQRIKGVLYASVTAIFWGFLAIALKVASGIMDPLTIVWFRFLVAFSVLGVYLSIKKPAYLKILYTPPLYLIIASLGLGINYIAYLYGIKLTTASVSQIVIQIGPIMLGVVGLVLFKEPISKRQAIGFIVAGSGLFLFYRENLKQMIDNSELYNMGILWIVVAAMAWVVYATLQKLLIKKYAPLQLNLFLFGLPVILFLPFIKPAGFLEFTTGNWILMIYLGINTLVAYGSLAMAFKYLEANKISVIITLNPIITFSLMGILAWMEVTWIKPDKFTPLGILAASLVIAGAILVVAFANPEKKKAIKELIQNPGKGTE